MAITLNSILTNLNTYIGDASEDRITNAERFQFATEAVSWLLEELGNEHSEATYNLDYYDGINYYKLTTALPDVLIGADLRRSTKLQRESMTRKSPREIAEEIGQKSRESVWGVERRDGDSYLVINHRSEYPKKGIATFDSSTSDDGTWTADIVNSDALNITFDVNERTTGSASLNFDVDVSQSANNRATIYLDKGQSDDLSYYEDLGSFTLDVYIPDVTTIASVTLRWSSDNGATPSTISNYWTATSTTDVNGNALVQGWNTLRFAWQTSVVVGTPDPSTIYFYSIQLNYSVGQVDDTDFRYDNLNMVKPEKLTFHYISWLVGTNNSGTDITAFTATSDIPFFSGRYDQYKYAVAHYASSLAYYSMRLKEEALAEEAQALKSLNRYRLIFESSKVREEKSFKIKGNNLRQRRYRRRWTIRN